MNFQVVVLDYDNSDGFHPRNVRDGRSKVNAAENIDCVPGDLPGGRLRGCVCCDVVGIPEWRIEAIRCVHDQKAAATVFGSYWCA